MLNNFRKLGLEDLTEEDLTNLANVVSQDSEMTSKFVFAKLAKNEMQPWRVETDRGNTLLVFEIKQKMKEKVLYIWYISGRGLLGNGQYVLDTLIEIGRINECSAIETFTHHRYAKYLTRAGFKIVHTFVRKEIE